MTSAQTIWGKHKYVYVVACTWPYTSVWGLLFVLMWNNEIVPDQMNNYVKNISTLSWHYCVWLHSNDKINTNWTIAADEVFILYAPRRKWLDAMKILAKQQNANITWGEIRCFLFLPLGGEGSILRHSAWSVSVGTALVKSFRKLHRPFLMWLRHKLSTLPTSSL